MKLKIKFFNFRNAWQSDLFRRCLCFTLCMLVIITAQAAGAADLNGVATKIHDYQPIVQNIFRAIGAVIVLAGVFNIFNKMNNGDQDVKKTIMLTIGGCIGYVALEESLPKFFGY